MAVQVQLSSLWLPSSTVTVPFVHCKSKTKPSTTSLASSASLSSSLSSSAPIIQATSPTSHFLLILSFCLKK